VSLAACASSYGDADVVRDSPDAATSGGEGGSTNEAGSEGGSEGGGPIDAGPQPEPLEVAVNQFATCATVRSGTTAKSYCWGGASPNIKEYIGAGASDAPINGFYVPRLVGGGALVLDKIYGTGTGSWFLATGNDTQGVNEVLSWGSNLFSQSGQGVPAATQNVLPARLKTTTGGATRTLQASTAAGGTRHGCLIEDSKLYCWGQNDNCQVGSGPLPACTPGAAQLSPLQTTPVAAVGKTIAYDRVATGLGHTCVLTHEAPGGSNQATVQCFGDNTSKQCGVDNLTAIGQAQAPTGVGSGSTQQVEIAAGERHSCAIVQNKLKCWGANNANQTDPKGDATPKPPTELESAGAVSGNLSLLSLASDATCLVAGGGAAAKSRAFCFGRGELGRDGNATGVEPVAGIENVRRLALSNTHGCAIATAIGGTEVGLYCWGSNVARAVDPNAVEDRFPTPRRVLFPSQ